MAAPLYFFPAVTREQLAPQGKLSHRFLAQYGDLDRVFADVADARLDASIAEIAGKGPGGSSGCILTAIPAVGEPPIRIGYFPDFQKWERVGEGPGVFWIGVDAEHPVGAADLARKRCFGGYVVELNGEPWTVPVIRDPEGGTGLPRDFRYADGGKVVQRIKSAYNDLWEAFGRAVWLFFDPEGPWPVRIDLEEGLGLCVQALALNYRIGRAEQNLLGLVDSETWYAILAAAVDYPTFRDVAVSIEAQKKTRGRSDISREIPPSPAPIDSSLGPPAGSPDTVPVSEN